MSDHKIRIIIVLLIPVLFTCAIALGIWHAVATALDELVTAWRNPQATRLSWNWKFWR